MKYLSITAILALSLSLGLTSCSKEKCASCSFTYQNGSGDNVENSDEACSSDDNTLAEFEDEFQATYDVYSNNNTIVEELSCDRK